jgi:bifunctional DNase/RNase
MDVAPIRLPGFSLASAVADTPFFIYDRIMLVPAEVWTVAKSEQGSAVLIKPIGSEVAVPIFIGPLEAHAILIGLANHKMPRPLTHDLLIATLEQLGAKVSRIEITELKEGTFYGRLVLSRAGEDIVMDSRPSDCVALAVRAKCPIFIDEGVVDEAGITISPADAEKTTKTSEVQAQIAFLQKELEKAVEQENYEEAAQLRDQIKQLETKL